MRRGGAFAYDFSWLPGILDRLKGRLRVAIVFGGDKSVAGAVRHVTFNARSWKSYEAVAGDIRDALEAMGFRHLFLFPDDMHLSRRLVEHDIHLVWLNTGGTQGFNPVSHTPSLLEMMGLPYVGHNPLNATVLDNKHLFKGLLKSLDVMTPPWMVWDAYQGLLDPRHNPHFQRAFAGYDGPFVVKPVSGRASLHVHVVDQAGEVPRVAAQVHQATRNHVLIERYVSGAEYCAAIYGRVRVEGGRLFKGSDPFAFSLSYRKLAPGERIFTSMDIKAIDGDRVGLLDPLGEAAVREQLSRMACTLYLECQWKTLIRLDVRADADGVLHVLEANPKPDLKRPRGGGFSIVALGLSELGMTYDELILSILADRLDYLLTFRADSIGHLVALLD